jgi:murein tripeptide amidase MpaA
MSIIQRKKITAALFFVVGSFSRRGGRRGFINRSLSSASAFLTTHHYYLATKPYHLLPLGITPSVAGSSSSPPLRASLRDLLDGKNTRSVATLPADVSKPAPAANNDVVIEKTLPIKETSPMKQNKKSSTDSPLSISDSYDSGNGEFVSFKIVDGEEDYTDVIVKVNIKADPFTDLEQKSHFQSFSFKSTLNLNSPAVRGIFSDKKSIKVKYIIDNAGEASYANAWNGASIFVSTKLTPFDPDSWYRTGDTKYENGCLSWTHVHDSEEKPSAFFAYFPPFSYERHLDLIARCAEAKETRVYSLGQTVLGRDIDCVKVGTGPRVCWIIHRQHPGESMASFYAEGLLNRLLGLDDKWDKVTEMAREMFTFYIVPNINPDSSANGYLRTNAVGSNLNREWCPSPSPPSADGSATTLTSEVYDAPTLDRSPEVYYLLKHMDEVGCDAFLDIHGDEDLPFNFLAGSQGMQVWDTRLEALHGAFLASYERANPDMQAKVSYEPDKPNEGMKNICSNQIAERFDCFSGTLEMPFKECWGRPGWGPDRARKLGASVLDALCYVQPYLRDKSNFWEGLPEEDAYVEPSSKY